MFVAHFEDGSMIEADSYRWLRQKIDATDGYRGAVNTVAVIESGRLLATIGEVILNYGLRRTFTFPAKVETHCHVFDLGDHGKLFVHGNSRVERLDEWGSGFWYEPLPPQTQTVAA